MGDYVHDGDAYVAVFPLYGAKLVASHWHKRYYHLCQDLYWEAEYCYSNIGWASELHNNYVINNEYQ